MQIQVDANPNCQISEQFVFNEIDRPRPIEGIQVEWDGQEHFCQVIGVDPEGQWVQAQAVKITDSGEGFAYLIYGGAWGIRIRPKASADQVWDLNNKHQWGEPFKIYGNEKDILYSKI